MLKIGGLDRVFSFEKFPDSSAIPVSDFQSDSICSVQLGVASFKIDLACILAGSCFWYASETWCGVFGGITCIVQSGCNPLWQPRCRHAWQNKAVRICWKSDTWVEQAGDKKWPCGWTSNSGNYSNPYLTKWKDGCLSQGPFDIGKLYYLGNLYVKTKLRVKDHTQIDEHLTWRTGSQDSFSRTYILDLLSQKLVCVTTSHWIIKFVSSAYQ